jgi:hypothetical protein
MLKRATPLFYTINININSILHCHFYGQPQWSSEAYSRLAGCNYLVINFERFADKKHIVFCKLNETCCYLER